ncbi:acyl-CoA dehydrogenase [Saccharobesus litoralis]|uniref:Acyl-coenzyme A dehydrogenase n=1 Tax=Saccharobesus litoralis TaxID=2172099 RepID=A0A2S0VU98_9ALTE|nr:acyl-CoA dehydrogenase FadE [Saccharobesus litoralis]AWB67742.1 acyl-CoA dehydrogenase [Saccharobesus litoralis]
MFYFIWLMCLVCLFCLLAYHRSSLTSFTLAIAIWLTAGSLFDIVGQFSWFIFLVIAIPLNISSVRQHLFSKPAFKIFRKIMPEMSKTEKEAIDAGTTWWEADLFRGEPDWHKLHNIPQPRLSPEEQAFLNGPVETVCSMVSDWDTTHKYADLSPEVWQYLKDNKFFALIIEKEYGGLEFSAYAQSCVLQKLMGTSTVLASTVGVPNSLGPAELLQQYGTEQQKEHYLPKLALGLEIPCFALTSPEAGSDAGAIPDFGIVCQKEINGEQVLGISLTFNKRYITLAPVATVIGLAFKLKDPYHLIGDKEDIGITCALIPRDTEGLEIGRRHFPLNVPFQNGPIKGENIFVPIDTIIGGVNMAGQGWRMLVECLSVGRAITLPSNATGGAKALSLATGAYSRIRRQFKLPIGKMEGIEEALALIGGNTYMMDATVELSTAGIDLGEKPSVISAIAKYHLTEKMRDVVNAAMDVHGGKGIMLGPNNYLGRGYQGAPVAITVEGANILTRNMIIYGQGAIRCHPYVIAEMESLALKDETEAINAFDAAICGHVGYVISNNIRSVWLSITNAIFAGSPYNDPTKTYYQQLTRFSAILAFLSDTAMITLGGALKRHERISARLGDLLSYQYLATATLKRYQDDGRPEADLPLVQWAVEDSLFKMESALHDLLNNFPATWLRRPLKIMLMPWGKTNSKPSDAIEHQIAKLLQEPNESRDRLGKGQYVTASPNNLFGELEAALRLILKAEPIYDRICKVLDQKFSFSQLHEMAETGLEQNIINEHEAEILKQAEQARLKAINVDDFDPLELVSACAAAEMKQQNTVAA